MKLWDTYHIPATVSEAHALLALYAGKGRIIAGGTDLLIDVRSEHEAPPEALIDITRIPELNAIHQDNGQAIIGAGVTHTQIAKTPFLAEKAACLVESCGQIGGPQVRNVATLGGNVAHALPAGDGTISLVALDAEVEILQYNKQPRWVPIREMYRGAGKSLLDSTRDILLNIRFKLCQEREASAFSRIMRPQGVALPILNCAVWIRLDESLSHFEETRICIAPVAPTPQRITAAENALKGQPIGEESIQQAIEAAQSTLQPRTSKYRATADYRHEMIQVLLQRTLRTATERATTRQSIPAGI